MSNPRGQSKIESQRRWRKAHPERKYAGSTKAQKKARREVINAAINPCYLKEARAILAGTKKRVNRCCILAGDE